MKSSDAEPGSIIMREIREHCIKTALKHEPVHSLSEILSLKSVSAITKLARAHDVKGYTKMDKAALEKHVAVSILDEKRMADILTIVDDNEWAFWGKAAAKPELLDKPAYIPVSNFFQEMGYIEIFYNNEKLHFIMPDEVKSVSKRLMATDFPEDRAHISLLNKYALAATSLYGLIKQDDFVELFNSQNKRKTDVDEIFGALLRFVSLNTGYCFWEEYIVHDTFGENDYEDVRRHAEVQSSKPRYLPSKEKFLRYSAPDYYELTPQIGALKNYILKNLCDDPDEADDIIDEIHSLCANEENMRAIMEVFNKRNIAFKSMEQLQEFMPYLVNVMNTTRLWLNHGHTPDELGGMDKLMPFPPTPDKTRKPGRNEPCPCGSGKKYKRCCGQ